MDTRDGEVLCESGSCRGWTKLNRTDTVCWRCGSRTHLVVKSQELALTRALGEQGERVMIPGPRPRGLDQHAAQDFADYTAWRNLGCTHIITPCLRCGRVSCSETLGINSSWCHGCRMTRNPLATPRFCPIANKSELN